MIAEIHLENVTRRDIRNVNIIGSNVPKGIVGGLAIPLDVDVGSVIIECMNREQLKAGLLIIRNGLKRKLAPIADNREFAGSISYTLQEKIDSGTMLVLETVKAGAQIKVTLASEKYLW